MSKLPEDSRSFDEKLNWLTEKFNRFDDKIDTVFGEKINQLFDYIAHLKKRWKAIHFLPEKVKILLNRTSRLPRLIKWAISIVAVSFILGFFGQEIYISYQSNKLISGLLYAGLSPQDTHQISAYLTERDIIYKISDDSTSVKVAEKDVHTLRMALAREELPEQGQILTKLYTEIEDYHAALETDLEKTLSVVEGISQPRVYIVPALTDQNEEISAPAFILLSLESISDEHPRSDLIDSIVHLIRTTVHEIDRDQITLLDGANQTPTEAPLDADLIAFLHSQYWAERELEKKVRDILKDSLGIEHMEILINAPLMPRSVLPGIGELPGEKRIARISATVVLDRQKSSKEYETVTATIEKALNLDPARGDRLTVLYLPFDRTQELRSHQEAQARERKEFWTNIAINVAKLLGIIAAMITLRFIIQAVGRGVEMRGDHS